MHNQRGFITLPILIVILVGIVALGGGAYFVATKKSTSQITPDISDTAIPTNPQAQFGTQTSENIQTTQNTQTKDTVQQPKKQETSPATNNLSLGGLFVTPNGTPTVKIPERWTAHVIYDQPLKAGDKVEYRTLVAFSNGEKSAAITYQLMANGNKEVDAVSAQAIAEDALGIDHYTMAISVKQFTQYGFSGSEITYKNPKLKVDRTSPGVVEVRNDIVTYGIDLQEYPEIVARVFYIPGYVVIVTGASSVETSSAILNGWYQNVFASVVLPSPFNDMPGGIPIASYMQLKTKFAEVAAKVDAAQATPKGIESDFQLSSCSKITVDMSIGDTDKSTNGQVTQVQKMLFEKYSVSGNITGRFDDLTLINVIRFQREMGLDGSGGIGAKTRAAFDRCKSTTSTSASATIDATSLVTSSQYPVLSGTAIGVNAVYVSLADRGEVFWHTGSPVVVSNGKWSVSVSIPNYKIPAGNYSVLVSGPDNPNNLLPELVRGTLTITY